MAIGRGEEMSNERAALTSKHDDAIQRRSFGSVDRRQLFGVMIVAYDLSLPLICRPKIQPIKDRFRL
jgi:hypothetical protein